jgi:Abortive infection alpha
MSEEAKAVQEVAKATGKVVDAASKTGTFIAKHIDAPIAIVMGMLGDHLQVTRYERQVRLMTRVEEINRQNGLAGPTRAIPLKLAVPLIQNATLEEDDFLQDRWAALLVNAANANFDIEIRRAYLGMLAELTALDVEILEAIYTLPDETKSVVTSELPKTARIVVGKEENLLAPSDEVMLSLGNLVRLGCLLTGVSWGGAEIYTTVRPTVLGRSFAKACRMPKAL